MYKILHIIIVLILIFSILIGETNAQPASENTSGGLLLAQAGTATEPTIARPDLRENTSQLLPGPESADFKKYFVDTLIPRVTRLLISITAAASVIFIIYGGYRMLFFMGTPENLEASKNIIIWSVVGLLISIFAYFIVSVLSGITF